MTTQSNPDPPAQPPAPGVGTASSKLVDRKAGSPTGAWRSTKIGRASCRERV